MKRKSVWGVCTVLGVVLAFAAMLTTDHASAGGHGKPAATAAPPAPVDPPMVKNRAGIEIRPAGIHWGMTKQQVATFYDRVIDRDFAPLYRRAQAGPQTARLDAAVANAKAAFRRSLVDFGSLPTGVDSTPLKGEYTYNNNESMLHLNRRGAGPRYFFFINDKLWKLYDEVPLGENRPLGATYQDAVGKLATTYGVIGRVTQPDYNVGRIFLEVDWQDATTHIRALDRSGLHIVGIVYEDRATLANLASLRTAKEKDVNEVDPDVAALMRPPSPSPAPSSSAAAPKKSH